MAAAGESHRGGFNSLLLGGWTERTLVGLPGRQRREGGGGNVATVAASLASNYLTRQKRETLRLSRHGENSNTQTGANEKRDDNEDHNQRVPGHSQRGI